MEKISIVLPVYNCEKYVGKTIESVLNQSYTDYEFIIINDGSTDNSLSIISNYANKDNRIKIISHTNKGLGESLNVGIRSAENELIVRIDQDDLMLPDRIAKQYAFLKENPNIAVISCLAYYINDDDKIIGKTFSDLKSVADCKKYLANNEPIGILHPGVMLRRSVLLGIGGYRGKFFPCEDIDLWNRLVEKGYNVVVMQDILMKYRISAASEITSRFINSRLKFEWVRETMWKRRKGDPEPEWETFINAHNNRSFLSKLNWKRKTYAKFYYRTAGFDIARKKYFSFMFHFISGLFMQPQYVLRKIFKQVL